MTGCYTMCSTGALGDGRIGAGLNVYAVARWGNAIRPKLL